MTPNYFVLLRVFSWIVPQSLIKSQALSCSDFIPVEFDFKQSRFIS